MSLDYTGERSTLERGGVTEMESTSGVDRTVRVLGSGVVDVGGMEVDDTIGAALGRVVWEGW